MVQFNQGCAIYILDKIFYIAFLFVGFCLIYQDEVIQRYQDRKTTFAVYSEPMHEMATLSVWIENIPPNFTLGEDFTVHFGRDFSNMSKLTYGQNNIEGSSLVVELEHISRGSANQIRWFKIRPLNLSPQNTPDHAISLTFSRRRPFKFSQNLISVHVWPTAENNTLHDCEGKYYDGDITNSVVAKTAK